MAETTTAAPAEPATDLARRDNGDLYHPPIFDRSLCECGCGEPAPIAQYTCRRDGYVKGEPLRFISQHHCRRPLADRFAAKVTPASDLSPNGMTGCLLWTGVLAKGYGHIRDGDKHRKATQVAWKLAGRTIPDGHVLDHLCRRPTCVNVEHLEPVTTAVNVQRGALAKLTVPQAGEIRSLVVDGWQISDIAAAYGVAWATVSRVHKGETWRAAA